MSTYPEITEDQYAAAIPPWCGCKTLQAHMDMLLCWSLVRFVERGEPKPLSSCEGCPIFEPPPPSGAWQAMCPDQPVDNEHADQSDKTADPASGCQSRQ